MLSRVAVLLIPLVLGCGARLHGRVADPADWRARGAFVLVYDNARLYTAPSADASYVQLDSFDDAARRDHPFDVLIMRQVGEPEMGFVSLLSDGEVDGEAFCRGYNPYPEYQLRFYVREGDRATVTSRVVTREFSDGTRVRLQPGVVVDGGSRVVLGGLNRKALALEFRPRELGLRFNPAGRLEVGAGTHTLELGAPLYYGHGREVVVLPEPWEADALLKPGFPVDSPEPRGDDATLVTTRSPCGELRARVDPEALHEAEPAGIAGGFGVRGGRSLTYRVPRDTPLSWPDGREAGRVVRTHALSVSRFERHEEGRTCWSIRGGLSVCASSRDITP